MLERLNKIEQRYNELETLLSDGEVMKNQNRFQTLAKEMASISDIVKLYREFKKNEHELNNTKQLLVEDSKDKEMCLLYEDEIKACNEKLVKLKNKLEDRLLAEEDENRDKNILVEIRAGTGGEEAALFASDLYRMYTKYAAIKHLKYEVMSTNETGIGGFKEIIFAITGSGAYEWFRFESGTHRVQRIPVTETSGRIHTSAVTVAVLPEAEEVEVEINPQDLRIDVYRSSGPGGQSVNTTDSAVRITHQPTGLVVTCQDEKSQHKNKAKAMRVLRARLYDKMQQEQADGRAANRKKQVGSGDRSERIRTYNYPDKRVTDHRIGCTIHTLERFLEGEMDEMIAELAKAERAKRLAGLST